MFKLATYNFQLVYRSGLPRVRVTEVGLCFMHKVRFKIGMWPPLHGG